MGVCCSHSRDIEDHYSHPRTTNFLDLVCHKMSNIEAQKEYEYLSPLRIEKKHTLCEIIKDAAKYWNEKGEKPENVPKYIYPINGIIRIKNILLTQEVLSYSLFWVFYICRNIWLLSSYSSNIGNIN